MDRVPALLRATSGPVPVNDFARWTALISAFTEHLLERYGEDEVLSWYFECFNEPDRMPSWVHNLMYDHFVAAVTRVHPRLRVGGPAMWTAALGQFLEHAGRGCDQVSGGPVRIDYVSSHRYAMSADETRNFPLVFPYVGDLVRWVEEYWAYARTFPRLLEVPFHLNEWGLIGRYAWGTRHFRAMELRDTEYAGLFLAKLVTGLVALEHWRPELGPERGKTPDLILYWGFAYEASRGTFLGNRSVLTAGPVLKPIWAVYEMLARLGEGATRPQRRRRGRPRGGARHSRMPTARSASCSTTSSKGPSRHAQPRRCGSASTGTAPCAPTKPPGTCWTASTATPSGRGRRWDGQRGSRRSRSRSCGVSNVRGGFPAASAWRPAAAGAVSPCGCRHKA